MKFEIIFRIVLFFLLAVIYAYIAWKNRKGFISGLKGENGKWEIPEIVVLVWLPTFFGIVICDALFGLSPSKSDWVYKSLDMVLLFALSGRVWVETVKNKNQNKDNEKTSD